MPATFYHIYLRPHLAAVLAFLICHILSRTGCLPHLSCTTSPLIPSPIRFVLSSPESRSSFSVPSCLTLSILDRPTFLSSFLSLTGLPILVSFTSLVLSHQFLSCFTNLMLSHNPLPSVVPCLTVSPLCVLCLFPQTYRVGTCAPSQSDSMSCVGTPSSPSARFASCTAASNRSGSTTHVLANL